MKVVLAFAALAWTAQAHVTATEPQTEEIEAVENRQLQDDFSSRIINGDRVKLGKYPWFISLQDGRRGSAFCGASLISSTWALTAAHCVYESENPRRVVLNTIKITDKGRPERGVKRVIMHPKYNHDTVRNDIALLELSESVDIAPVILARKTPSPSTMCTVIGYGVTKPNAQAMSKNLFEVDVPIVSRKDCTARGAYNKGDIFDTNICAGYEAGGKDSCSGDSGGPLIESSSKAQVGIVSWGEGCAARKKYGVYADVADYISWIEKYVTNLPAPGSGGGGDVPAPVPSVSPTTADSAPEVTLALWRAEERFCRRQRKPHQCARYPERCVFYRRRCHTVLEKPVATKKPTKQPTPRPTKAPTRRPTRRPTKEPTPFPTNGDDYEYYYSEGEYSYEDYSDYTGDYSYSDYDYDQGRRGKTHKQPRHHKN